VCYQGIGRARPGQEAIGTGTLNGLPHPRQRIPGDDDDRDGRSAIVRLEAPTHLQAVQDRHRQIEDDHVGPVVRHDVDHLTAVRSLVDDEAGQCQRRDIELPLVFEVISNQHALHNILVSKTRSSIDAI